MITPDIIRRIMPTAGDRADKFCGPLNEAMAWRNIMAPDRQAAFLAQLAHESGELLWLSENLNYSPQGLMSTWPRRFNAAQANLYARKPQAIANYVYANRMGNGDEASGDGWRYRGRGLFQVTGRKNYRACGADLNMPLEDNPDLLEEPDAAAFSAAWYWHKENLNTLADCGAFEAITKRINGGLNGLEDRLRYYNKALGIL